MIKNDIHGNDDDENCGDNERDEEDDGNDPTKSAQTPLNFSMILSFHYQLVQQVSPQEEDESNDRQNTMDQYSLPKDSPPVDGTFINIK